MKRGAVPSLYLNGEAKDDQSSDSQDSQIIIFEEYQSMNEVLNTADVQAEEIKTDDRSLRIERKEEAATRDTCEYTILASHSEPQVSER